MDGNTKTVVIVAIVDVIPVAVGRARVVFIVIPRAAAQHLPGRPDRTLLPGRGKFSSCRVFLHEQLALIPLTLTGDGHICHFTAGCGRPARAYT
jgi:hypothetical protein